MDPLTAIRAELSRGEYLTAADLGTTAIGDDAGIADLELLWATGLSLARCGATDRAAELLDLGLVDKRATTAATALQEDLGGLRARLRKDRAFRSADPQISRAHALEAATGYQQLADRFRSHYAAVNAATMFLASGDGEKARRMAARTLQLTEPLEPTAPDLTAVDRFWRAASRSEALLILGRTEEAKLELAGARAENPSWGVLATTINQHRLVCNMLGLGSDHLRQLGLPTVVHYTGHMFRSGPEHRLTQQITRALAADVVGAVYGALACGSDILVAEAALDAGIELHVRLPCPTGDFVPRSVEPGGTPWVGRFERALARATSVEFEPTQGLSDAAMFDFGDQVAMGSAVLRAAQLGTEARQLAIWDSQRAIGRAGTASAVATWRSTGREVRVIPMDRSETVAVDQPAAMASGVDRTRNIRSIVFVDISDFSKLREAELPRFFDSLMKTLAETALHYDDSIVYRNTWGDALCLIFDDTRAAAECAVAFQGALAARPGQLGHPRLLARIACHAGPVFDGFDHVRGEPTIYGTHVTRAARMEPRTPPGEVFATASFASLLALHHPHSFQMDYVGQVPTAKDYGSFRMFSVH